MVRLSKLTPLGQSSWGPHSLSSPIKKPKPDPLPAFPLMKTLGDEVVTPRTMKKLHPLSLSRAEKARQSPFLKHLSKRDREERLMKLGSVTKATGEFLLEHKLSTLLRNQMPTSNTGRDNRRRKPTKPKCKKQVVQSTVQNSYDEDWWRTSDYEQFNYPNPNGSGADYEDEGLDQVNERSFYYSSNIDEFDEQGGQENDIQFVDQGNNMNMDQGDGGEAGDKVYYFYDVDSSTAATENTNDIIDEDDTSSVGSNLYEEELVSSRELDSNSIRAAALEGAVVSSTGPDSERYTDGMIMDMNA